VVNDRQFTATLTLCLGIVQDASTDGELENYDGLAVESECDVEPISPNNETTDDNPTEEPNDNEFVIPSGREPIFPDSAITKGQAVIMLLSFIYRHHLTNTAVEDLLDLLALLCPGCLPATKFLLMKGLFSRNNCLERHVFCSVCFAYVTKYADCSAIDKCPYCDSAFSCEQSIKDGNFFLYMPIENQLQALLSKYEPVKKSGAVQSHNLNSVLTGNVMKNNLSDGNISDTDITLIWNTDGAPVFSSSKKSIWPLQACVNEISPRCKDNLLLIGLWFGTQKPRPHTFLKPFVDELQHLGSSGMHYTNPNGESVYSKVFALCCSTDSCARPVIRNTTQFNGRFGCDWCLHEGKVVERGEGKCRIYLPDAATLRSEAGFLNDAMNSTAENPVNGVKGVSPLLSVPLFNIVTGFVPDYLHCVLLGIVRMFSALWFDSANHDKPWYVKQSGVSQISDKLLSLRPPSDISRLPRSLAERKYWKGSEWKSFLLYYSLIVLPDVLPTKYTNHWFLLVYSIHALLQDCVTGADVAAAESALQEFVQGVQALYGDQYCTFNVHQLLHLCDAVQNWGPLWAFSCFRFENNIGQILSLVRGSKCVPEQIFQSFLTRSVLPTLFEKYCSVLDMHVDSLMQRLLCSGVYVRKTKVSTDDVHLYGCPAVRMLTLCESLAYSRTYNVLPNSTMYKIYYRFAYNGLYMTSASYKQTNRNCDDTVQLTDGHFCSVVCCAVGKFSCACVESCDCTDNVAIFVMPLEKVLGQTAFRSKTVNITSDRFLIRYRNSNEIQCIRPTNIVRKCFRHTSFLVPIPTRNECD